MKVTIPAITNPGVSFTKNSLQILERVQSCFSDSSDKRIPYKDFQQKFEVIEKKGASKIRMLFPLCRKCGCIYPDDGGDVVFVDRSFFTQLGKCFLKASRIFFDVEKYYEVTSTSDAILFKAREVYFGVTCRMMQNLMEEDKVYECLLRFVYQYERVTKEEVMLLLFALEKTSSVECRVENCVYNKEEIDVLISKYRGGEIIISQEKANNAASYFIAMLKSLLFVQYSSGVVTLSNEVKKFYPKGVIECMGH